MKELSTIMTVQMEEQFSEPAACNRCVPGSIPVQSMQNYLLYKEAVRLDLLPVRPFSLPVACHRFCIFINLSVTACRIICATDRVL